MTALLLTTKLAQGVQGAPVVMGGLMVPVVQGVQGAAVAMVGQFTIIVLPRRLMAVLLLITKLGEEAVVVTVAPVAMTEMAVMVAMGELVGMVEQFITTNHHQL